MAGSDSALAAIAAGQHGIFDLDDARACGFTRGAIDFRLAQRRWIPLYRRVYALGHAELRTEGRWLAAVKACGPGALLSHVSAAAAWDLRAPGAARIHVTVPFGVRRSPDRRSITVHETRHLPAAERAMLGPIPLTSVARTLRDLAPRSTERALEALISEADLRDLYDGRAVRAALEARPNRRLAALLDRLEGVGVPRTRSEMEVRMRSFCDAHDLPAPAVNAIVEGAEVDFWWPHAGVVVETDGWRYHRMPGQRERDAAKRLALEAAGLRVIGLTWHQIDGRPRATAAALRQVLDYAGRSISSTL